MHADPEIERLSTAFRSGGGTDAGIMNPKARVIKSLFVGSQHHVVFLRRSFHLLLSAMTSTSSPTATLTTESQSKKKSKVPQDESLQPMTPEDSPTKDFGFLPIPRNLRYDPQKPHHFGLLLNVAFGFASTFSE